MNEKSRIHLSDFNNEDELKPYENQVALKKEVGGSLDGPVFVPDF